MQDATVKSEKITIEGGGGHHDDNTEYQAVKLGRLQSWFETNGGSVSKIKLANLGGEMKLSLVTSEVVSRGEIVMSIPISLCMTTQAAIASDLSPVFSANPYVMDAPDEVLALHLMREKRKGEASFWKDFIRTLPDDVDSPIRWTKKEMGMLDGTTMGRLSKMMAHQVYKDWLTEYVPLKEAFPDLLGTISYKDYQWALTSVWSRAFDYSEEGRGGQTLSQRAMLPVINAANHDPSAASSLSDMISFEKGGCGLPSTSGGGQFIVRAGRDYDVPGEQFFISYGRYSNAKLLYSYGFVLPDNPYGAVDYWVRVPPTDSGIEWKQALLDGHPLTAQQGYDFTGTLRSGGWISPALLATARIAQLSPDERPAAENAFKGKIVSVRNETAALGALAAGLRGKLDGPNKSSADDEVQLIATLVEQLQQQQQDQQANPTDPEKNFVPVDTLEEFEKLYGQPKLERQIAAARVRLEEKLVISGALRALEVSLQQLQSAGAEELENFRPLDASG